jgi:hypothetical protein
MPEVGRPDEAELRGGERQCLGRVELVHVDPVGRVEVACQVDGRCAGVDAHHGGGSGLAQEAAGDRGTTPKVQHPVSVPDPGTPHRREQLTTVSIG